MVLFIGYLNTYFSYNRSFSPSITHSKHRLLANFINVADFHKDLFNAALLHRIWLL